MGIRLKRTCLTSSHEEAGHMLFQQYQGEKVRSISDDTCVNPSSPFVCLPQRSRCALHISSPVTNRSIVDLGAIVQKNKDTPKAIQVMHALSGANTVIATYNVGKQLACKTIEQPTKKSDPSL